MVEEVSNVPRVNVGGKTRDGRPAVVELAMSGCKGLVVVDGRPGG